jgi:hypothetical protein
MASEDELGRAFAEGRLSRRAYVRQLVAGGLDMPAALERADSLVPRAEAAAPEPAAAAQPRSVPRTPKQTDGLEITVVHDGYVVFDPRHDRMHNLNLTAALVFELCNGRNDEGEIARLVQGAYGLPDPPAEETRRCLADLLDQDLIG